MDISLFAQITLMFTISMLFIIFVYFCMVLASKIEKKLIIKKAKKNNWITSGECWHTEQMGVISNIGYRGMCEMIATFTYKVGKYTYEHKKKFYPDRNGKFSSYNNHATVYYDGNNPDKCVVICNKN